MVIPFHLNVKHPEYGTHKKIDPVSSISNGFWFVILGRRDYASYIHSPIVCYKGQSLVNQLTRGEGTSCPHTPNAITNTHGFVSRGSSSFSCSARTPQTSRTIQFVKSKRQQDRAPHDTGFRGFRRG
jgi:hypothetical protein